MTVTDLWTMWDELRMKTVVDIYTCDGDILEVNQLFEKVFQQYKYYKVCAFGCASYNQFHKNITVEKEEI